MLVTGMALALCRTVQWAAEAESVTPTFKLTPRPLVLEPPPMLFSVVEFKVALDMARPLNETILPLLSGRVPRAPRLNPSCTAW